MPKRGEVAISRSIFLEEEAEAQRDFSQDELTQACLTSKLKFFPCGKMTLVLEIHTFAESFSSLF